MSFSKAEPTMNNRLIRTQISFCVIVQLMSLFCTRHSIAEDQVTAPVFHPVEAKLVKPRAGLGNVLEKLKAGKEVKVAYFGGSITAAAGWRVYTKEWFSKQFSAAKVEEIHAAIGGTGSDLGVFRVGHDVIEKKPDLVFIEFAVNDGGAKPEQIWRCFDGIIRQIWKADPKTDICFVYTYRVGYEKELGEGVCPQAASAMELIADHYDIPSINVALKVVELQMADKLVYQSAEKVAEGLIRFSEDGVHPLDEGHKIYSEVVAEGITAMEKVSNPIDHTQLLEKAFVTDNWDQAKMVPISRQMLEGDWQELDAEATFSKRFGNRMGVIWESKKPGSKLSFKVRGTAVKIYDLLAPDGGQVTITVDGKTQSKPVPRFDSYCTYERIATLSIADNLDPKVEHTVSLEIHPDQPDRTPVAFRLKDPEKELKEAKYQGTNVRVSQILVLGDVVK